MRQDGRGRRRLCSPPGQRPHHRSRCQEARHPGGEGRRERRSLREHFVGVDSARPGGCRRRRTAETWETGADDRNGCGPHLGFGLDRMDPRDERSRTMTKIAFMFPGQGSFGPGMGREIAEAEPEAMAVYDEGSKASGLDLRRLCFSGTSEELMETEVQQPALVTTSLAINAALRAHGIRPDFVVGHSVGEFSALGAAGSIGISEAIALVRERGLAMAAAAKERPGSMAAILGLVE